jgi:dUTP pyrophosphatase
MSFKIKKLSNDAVIPVRATIGSAGLDLSSVEDVNIPPQEWRLIGTGLSIAIPNDCYARIAPRSGLAFKYGLFVNAGVIDSDYRGEIKVIIYNSSSNNYTIRKGDRIAQIIFERIFINEFTEVSDLDETESRGSNGFGSTGIN